MRSSLKTVFIAITTVIAVATVLLSTTRSEASNYFAACMETPAAPAKNIKVDGASRLALAAALGQSFESSFQDSLADIELNRACLKGEESKACEDRKTYFFEQIPKQWRRFRQLAALSAWSQVFIQLRDARAPFNSELSLSDVYRAGDEPLEGLSLAELTIAQREWDRQWELAKNKTFEDIRERRTRGLDLPAGVQMESERSLAEAEATLRTPSFGFLSRSQNPWVLSTFRRIENIVFRLNQRRMLQALVQDPILAHLKSETVSKDELLRAFARQETMLLAERDQVRSRYQALAKQASEISAHDLEPLLDYFMVTEDALRRVPGLCETATEAVAKNIRRQTVIGYGALAVMVAASPFVPVSWTLIGAGTVQALALRDAYSQKDRLKNLAYSTSSPELALNTADDVYVAGSRAESEVILSAAFVTGLPLLRVSKLLSTRGVR